jgi:tRNA pseudouridine55 synthase
VSIHGVCVVNKAAGWTSHDVVNKMRGVMGTRRVGHLGTLDPLATGVLPIMIGQATRLARFWGDSEKTYEALVRFGFSTNTYDREGEATSEAVPVALDTVTVEACLGAFRGSFQQKPPPVSAKKIQGVPAYKLARKNIEVDLAPVPVEVYELTLLDVAGDRARLRVRCSAGTYIRSIAHELGAMFGCGAHIEELARTVSGPFRIEHARTLDELNAIKCDGRLGEAVIPPPELLPEFPNVSVDDLTARQIRQGRDFHTSPFRVTVGTQYVKAIGPDGDLIAIGEIVLPNLYHPVVVLAE